MKKRKIIISLIKDDLCNTKLINGLEELGFFTDRHRLHISEVVFKLLKLDNDKDELFEKYLEWCSETIENDLFNKPAILNRYAEKIYKMLLVEKNKE